MSRTVDFSSIPTRQDAIHIRLEQWARWVKEHQMPWGLHPMWRNSKSSRQWDVSPYISQPLNTLECLEIERAVQILPEKHRIAIRWAYCFPNRSATAVRQQIGATREELSRILDDARDRIIFRINQKLVDTA